MGEGEREAGNKCNYTTNATTCNMKRNPNPYLLNPWVNPFIIICPDCNPTGASDRCYSPGRDTSSSSSSSFALPLFRARLNSKHIFHIIDYSDIFSEVAPYASTSIPSLLPPPTSLYIPPASALFPLPSGSSEANRKLCTIYITSKGNMPTIKD